MTRRKLTDEEKLEKEQRQKQYRKDYYLKNKDRIIAQAIANGKKRDHIHKVLYNLYVDGLLRVVDNETDMIDKAVKTWTTFLKTLKEFGRKKFTEV